MAKKQVVSILNNSGAGHAAIKVLAALVTALRTTKQENSTLYREDATEVSAYTTGTISKIPIHWMTSDKLLHLYNQASHQGYQG